MATCVPVAFSTDGEYLAHSSPDGRLKIWETTTGSLKQEYIPSSHLSATCTCLAWASLRQTTCPVPKRKRRSMRGADGADLIALGTMTGSVLLYSMVKGDLQTQLVDGHSDRVNGLCWSSTGDTLYSCSADKHIIEWDISSGKVRNKWKGDRESIHSISVCHGRTLLTAGRTIKLWDLDTHECLKRFTGHATEVFKLLFVPFQINNSQNGESALDSVENTYFLSAASGDRLINAWQIKSTKDKNAIASFALPDEPIDINISNSVSRDQPTLLAAVTKSGQLLIFEHVLNGKCKKPLQPKVTVRIATPKVQDEVPKPIHIVAAQIKDDMDQTVLLAHGNFLKPTFEKQPYSSLESEVCLIREDPNKSTVISETSVSKIKTPDTSQEVLVLGPGHITPSGPIQDGAAAAKSARKRRKSITQEMTMEDRLNAISIDKPTDAQASSHPPTADTLAHLLSQGLQSQDKKILNNVLQNTNETVISNTVKRLPVPVIVPLVQELTKRLHGHAQSGMNLLKWIRCILMVHTSYLMTFPELVEKLSSLYQMMDSRLNTFSRLSKLQGKLNLVLSQISAQTQDDDEKVSSQTPMMLYQDESSDEDVMEDMLGSPSDEDWEDMSDMDQEDEAEGDADEAASNSDENMDEN